MITLRKSKYLIYLIVGIIILFSIGSIIFYNNENDSPWIIFIGICNTVLFIWGIEKTSFKGRYGYKTFFYWLLYLIASILALAFILFIFIGVNNLLGINSNEKLNSAISVPIGMTIVFYFIFKFFQILYKRLQDLNLPGYYLVGIIPIVSWIIGIKIFKSGNKFLGVLVFLNLAIGILYILFAKGSKGSNYFGIKPVHISRFEKEVKRIQNAKSLGNSEKEELQKEIAENYKAIEIKELEEFKKREIDRLIIKEKLRIDENSIISQNQQDF